MKKLSDFVYGIVGLGLMGGSLGKAIRENILSVPGCTGKIYGSDINSASLDLASRQHICDRVFSAEDVDSMLGECDFVYICLYPHATVDFLKQHRDSFKSGSIVSDISGVKTLIFDSLNDFYRPDVDFIPGHPMAGSEKEGYANSSGGIFKNHNYIVMPLETNSRENVELFKTLVGGLGFTRVVETDAKIHDHKIAFTSQLCHVIASSLVDSAEDDSITAFGGGSFEDLTRIALINAPLWTELFLANKRELLSHIDKFTESLGRLRDEIEKGEDEKIRLYLENVRTRRMAMARTDLKCGK
ncbi:MAG: prephenate dehydrogenase [Treponema sp.]|nr:prephenate dehydrogenase [Treponema sp.]